jgi:glycosyl-4,4'-diaponeurosporenoate acyltransferase
VNDLVAAGADALTWAVWGVATGYAVHRLPLAAVDHDTWMTRIRPWERRATRGLRVRRWQRHLPAAGSIFGGMGTRRIGGRGFGMLERYAAETRRAELVHWLGFVPLIFFVAWNPLWLWWVMAVYAVAVNVPCLLSLRYNRARIGRVLDRRL